MAHKKIDLTDQRFGDLVILKEAPMRGINRYWLCQCDCGSKPKEVRQSHLKSGGTTSCGCSIKKGHAKKDLANQVFGKLTVIAPTEKRKQGKIVWKCMCSCGNTDPVFVVSTYLINGDTKSCGCLKDEQNYENFVIGYEKERVNGVNKSLLKSKIRKDNKSGHKGVHFHKATGKWYAQLSVNGVTHRSSLFKDKKSAISARLELEEKHHKPILEVDKN